MRFFNNHFPVHTWSTSIWTNDQWSIRHLKAFPLFDTFQIFFGLFWETNGSWTQIYYFVSVISYICVKICNSLMSPLNSNFWKSMAHEIAFCNCSIYIWNYYFFCVIPTVYTSWNKSFFVNIKFYFIFSWI